MKHLLENFGIALCGLTTSVLAALANVAIARKTGLNLFTISVWFVVPAGALFMGMCAASGYYLGSLFFHKRASATLLVQMVWIAAAAQCLIYWAGYTTLVLDDGRRVADVLPFRQYMDVLLTKAHYRIGRGQTDVGEVGHLGYVMAVAQFMGFLVGALAVFFYLYAKPVCAACSRYLRRLAGTTKTFANSDAAAGYFDRLLTVPVGGPDFAALIRSEAKVAKVEHGALRVNTSLLGCPICQAQRVEEKVTGYVGREWKGVKHLTRSVKVPKGIDLTTVFRA